MRICEKCKGKAQRCENGNEDHQPITVHDHEYGEWYCEECWDDYSDDERGLEWHNVVEEPNGETTEESRAESQGATS